MMNLSPLFLALTFGSILALLPASVQAVPPANDNFANRQVLTGQAVSSTPVTIDSATREGLERQDTGGQTVWYTWTAPQDGIVTMNTSGTNFYNSRISVFNGADLPDLVAIAKGNANYYLSTVTFFSKAGFVYQIAIGVTESGETGTAVLNIINKATTITAPVVVATPAGTNDNLAQAILLSAPNLSAFTYPLEATSEALEPDNTGNQTVWWIWTAPVDAQVTMSNAGSSSGASYFDGFLSIFNGTSYADLTTVAQRHGATTSITFPVKAGSKYYICVGEDEDVEGGNSTTATTSVLNITTAPLAITSPVSIESPAAANDNFANAQDLGSNPAVTGFGFNSSATTETLESSANGNYSLWWNWTAPQDGNLTASTNGTDFGHYLNVYTGSVGSRRSHERHQGLGKRWRQRRGDHPCPSRDDVSLRDRLLRRNRYRGADPQFRGWPDACWRRGRCPGVP